MANFNKVIIAGNLTRDPELRYTPKGTAVVKFGVAINRSWKSETGEKKEEVTFVDVDAWERQAEVIAQYFRKGRPILVEGRLQLDSWEDKTTHEKKSKLKVRLESFSFIDTKGPEDASGASAAPSGEPVRRPAAPAKPAAPAAPAPAAGGPPENGEPPPEEDDVPF
jgi:single-strand DNA-binding protein